MSLSLSLWPMAGRYRTWTPLLCLSLLPCSPSQRPSLRLSVSLSLCLSLSRCLSLSLSLSLSLAPTPTPRHRRANSLPPAHPPTPAPTLALSLPPPLPLHWGRAVATGGATADGVTNAGFLTYTFHLSEPSGGTAACTGSPTYTTHTGTMTGTALSLSLSLSLTTGAPQGARAFL